MFGFIDVNLRKELISQSMADSSWNILYKEES